VEPETSKYPDTRAGEESPTPVNPTATGGLQQSDEPFGSVRS
jgi:hypothetical protein